jgi:hypothetical protein
MKTSTIKFFGFAIMLVSLAMPNAAIANDVVKKVTFPRGRSTIIYNDKLPEQYAVYHAYVVRARRGQRLTVKLTSTDQDASFSIYETKGFGPDEDTIFLQDPAVREHTAVLPITSEYSIQIYGVRNINDAPSGDRYTVQITLR